jgi:4-amino-4-deoxy-L-arabinose transferase-like glycosyltransferase
MTLRILFFIFLGVDALLLVLEIPDLSISYHEARIFFLDHSPLHYLINISTSLFGQNDYALRLPMIVLHLLSGILLYEIAKPYAKYERDRLWMMVIYMLLPGVNSAAILVDDAGLILFFVMLYVYLHQRCYKLAYGVFPFLMLVDASFMFLYFASALYAYESQKSKLFIVSTVLFVATLLIYGFDVSGAPEGQFLDTLGIYAIIFSPIVFLYLFYVLYRHALLGERNYLFYIATSAFILSLLLSFRQRIDVAMFAPYVMVALPLAMQRFFHSYRVRLRAHRTKYRLMFIIAFSLLIVNAVSVFLHKEIYYLLDNPKDHFAYRLHVADVLAQKLRDRGITCIDSRDKQMQLRLQFYGIEYCTKYRLDDMKSALNDNSVTIFHRSRILYHASVTKVHD